MTIDEIRAIREKTSLETIGMTTEELRQHFAYGATEIERRIAEIRKERGIVLESSNDNTTSKSYHKNEHAYVRDAEYYSNLAETNAKTHGGCNMAAHESIENYNNND